MDDFIIVRALHVLAVLMWIGGVAFVTTVVMPSIRATHPPGDRMTAFHGIEGRFAPQAGIFDQALAEIRKGRKQSHWMWFIFPQLEGLGHSEMARRYAIRSIDEARAYLTHPMLGPRLCACVTALQTLTCTSAEQVFGPSGGMSERSRFWNRPLRHNRRRLVPPCWLCRV